MQHLFSPLPIKSLTLRDRLVVSPMCQYSSVDGFASDWHFAHLARFAIGGFGLVIVEAAAVTDVGRITYADLGIWKDEHVAGLKRIVDFLHTQGTVAGIQLAHAGRKASSLVPWRGGVPEREDEKPIYGYEDWIPVGPSAIAHSAEPSVYKVPHALTIEELGALTEAFVAARRALAAGFDMIEIHGAHGYLLNQFLSPVANRRDDAYGGSRENRMRFPLEVVAAVRAVWPAEKALFMRLSVTDGRDDGWTPEDSVALSLELKRLGVDVVDCSSGGFEGATIAPAPNYQVPLARIVRDRAGIPTMAVGLIGQSAKEADAIVTSGEADLVAMARTALDDPQWPLHAARELGQGEEQYARWPKQAGYAVKARDRVLKRGAFGG